MNEVLVQRISTVAAPDDAHLRAWARRALALGARQGEVVLRLVDPEESRALNLTYRGKDRPTNVLSFPAADGAELPPELRAEMPLGDLLVCAAVVNAEAVAQGKAPEAHWAHIVMHGCLHLLGYDHESETEAQEMEGLERRLLAELNFSDPYE